MDKRHPARRTNFNRHLIVGTTHTTAFDFNHGLTLFTAKENTSSGSLPLLVWIWAKAP
jgi:hypothetical protein